MGIDFVVIRANRATLTLSNETNIFDVNFDAPGIDEEQQSILAYVIDPRPVQADDTVRYQIKLDDHIVIQRRLTEGDDRSILDVLAPGAVRANGNKLTIFLVEGRQLVISDVVLFYK